MWFFSSSLGSNRERGITGIRSTPSQISALLKGAFRRQRPVCVKCVMCVREPWRKKPQAVQHTSLSLYRSSRCSPVDRGSPHTHMFKYFRGRRRAGYWRQLHKYSMINGPPCHHLSKPAMIYWFLYLSHKKKRTLALRPSFTLSLFASSLTQTSSEQIAAWCEKENSSPDPLARTAR